MGCIATSPEPPGTPRHPRAPVGYSENTFSRFRIGLFLWDRFLNLSLMKPFRIGRKPATCFLPFCFGWALLSLSLAPAQTPVHPFATNEYHGVKVVDRYQWLENGADPAVQTWTRDQNARAR